MNRRALWEQRIESARKRVTVVDAAHALQQAEVAMSALTRDPNWDGFVQMVQFRRNEAEASAQSLRERLQSSEFLPLEKLAALRHELALTRARVEALDEVIRIPAEVLKAARGTSE